MGSAARPCRKPRGAAAGRRPNVDPKLTMPDPVLAPLRRRLEHHYRKFFPGLVKDLERLLGGGGGAEAAPAQNLDFSAEPPKA